MKKTILEVYALTVCFFTITCFAVTLGVAIWDVVQMVSPQFTMSNYEYSRSLSNDSFCAWNDTLCKDDKKKRLSDAEITKKRVNNLEYATLVEKREGFNSLIRMLIIMLVDALIFIPHWIIAQRARGTV